MTLSGNVKSSPAKSDLSSESLLKEMNLILYNDEVNTFEFVIESLIEVCGHNPEQAEQCALITHTKGKCDIKKDSFIRLKLLKEILLDKGLSVVIE
jgi:ATP-dependent Clp protease adaptor protein ClpS